MALNFKPKNNYLLCEKVTVEKVTESGIVITSDISKIFSKMAKVIEPSPKLGILVDEYQKNETVIYPDGVPELFLMIDDKEYVMLKKEHILLGGKDE